MKFRKAAALLLAGVMSLVLAGCGQDGPGVYVQSVGEICNAGAIAQGDRFAGMVVSENVAEIRKDQDKSVAELLVREGDDVTEGQVLFSYNTDELQLTLDKQRLELEQMQAMVDNYKSQIKELESEREGTSGTDHLQYTVQIQTMQVDLKETELKIEAKKKEIEQSENVMNNATVCSPVTGRIQSISENGTDNYGNPTAYITIQQVGSYRIKGTIGELQMGAIFEGTRIRIVSRTDSTRTWSGTVSLVDYENATQGSGNEMYYGMDSDAMTSSSRYPFYVEPDSTQGLMLGQHVYLEVDSGEEQVTGLQLPDYFVCYDEDGSPYVWAEKDGKLEKRPVILGDMNMMLGTWTVTDGLTEKDYIAFPNEEVCAEGVPTTHDASKAIEAVEENAVEEPMDIPVEEPMDIPMEEPMDIPMEEPMDIPVEEPVGVDVAEPVGEVAP